MQFNYHLKCWGNYPSAQNRFLGLIIPMTTGTVVKIALTLNMVKCYRLPDSPHLASRLRYGPVLWEKSQGLLPCCDVRTCLPLPMFKFCPPDIGVSPVWMPSPLPNPHYLLRILPAFLMMGPFPVCVIDLDSFIRQIFAENFSCSILAECQTLVFRSLVISFPRSQFQILLSFLPFESQFQVICSWSKKISRSYWVFIRGVSF